MNTSWCQNELRVTVNDWLRRPIDERAFGFQLISISPTQNVLEIPAHPFLAEIDIGSPESLELLEYCDFDVCMTKDV